MSPLRRILTSLHAALGRWLAKTEPPAVPKSKCSWFGYDPETLRAAFPSDADEEEAEEWDRKFSRINSWDPWGKK